MSIISVLFYFMKLRKVTIKVLKVGREIWNKGKEQNENSSQTLFCERHTIKMNYKYIVNLFLLQ